MKNQTSALVKSATSEVVYDSVTLNALFNKQKAYFNSDTTKSYEWRIDQLNRMEALLTEHYQEFCDAMGRDFKTANLEQVFEIDAAIAGIQYMRTELAEWMKPEPLEIPKFLNATGSKGHVYRDPYGVALIIGPYNGPLVLLVHPAVTALSAGNPVMLKLSTVVPNTSGLFLDLIPQYFEEEAVSVVTGNREVVTELLKIPFDFIFFTGSVSTGKVIMRAAAENLTPVVLELGGQNPAIVDETVNIREAARKIVWGATAWGGQWCTSPNYAYVHESIAEEFVKEAKQAVIEMYGTDPKNNIDYSRIITSKEVTRLAGLIDPAKVAIGGDYDEEARYFAPTLLYPVAWTDKVMEDEIFGPILAILPYSDLKNAVAEIKKRPSSLSGYIFSKNQKTIDYLINSLSFGGGVVNHTNLHLFMETFPFGGIGASGMGNYFGKAGYHSLTHEKAILQIPDDMVIDHVFPPFTPEKIKDLQEKWSQY
ncbi:aldehyde dehydrogenase family protein [Mucilaginibacter sp.]|jgi:aldehyde dehydrogenase (NAD+)|uniref:aldehyde dehydrogenase family protein n=1 Tax=Mucilaginibacter sp. TaxID=1882438 RepID=UPI003567CEBE